MLRELSAGIRAFAAEHRHQRRRASAIAELSRMDAARLRDLGIRRREEIEAYVDGTLPACPISPIALMALREPTQSGVRIRPRLRLVASNPAL